MKRRVSKSAVPIVACGLLWALLGACAWAGPTSGGHSYSRRAGASGSGTSYSYAVPVYAPTSYVAPAATSPAAASTTRGAFYYAPDGSTGNDADTAVIKVTVPASAEIWFNNYKTKLTGTTRTFVSPPLNLSQSHRYHVRVRWLENGQEVVQERDVPIAPGTQTSVQFSGLASTSAR